MRTLAQVHGAEERIHGIQLGVCGRRELIKAGKVGVPHVLPERQLDRTPPMQVSLFATASPTRIHTNMLQAKPKHAGYLCVSFSFQGTKKLACCVGLRWSGMASEACEGQDRVACHDQGQPHTSMGQALHTADAPFCKGAEHDLLLQSTDLSPRA